MLVVVHDRPLEVKGRNVTKFQKALLVSIDRSSRKDRLFWFSRPSSG
jgi:hypothetical protein